MHPELWNLPTPLRPQEPSIHLAPSFHLDLLEDLQPSIPLAPSSHLDMLADLIATTLLALTTLLAPSIHLDKLADLALMGQDLMLMVQDLDHTPLLVNLSM